MFEKRVDVFFRVGRGGHNAKEVLERERVRMFYGVCGGENKFRVSLASLQKGSEPLHGRRTFFLPENLWGNIEIRSYKWVSIRVRKMGKRLAKGLRVSKSTYNVEMQTQKGWCATLQNMGTQISSWSLPNLRNFGLMCVLQFLLSENWKWHTHTHSEHT